MENEMPPTKPDPISDPSSAVDRLRHALADKQARELADLNKKREGEGLPPLSELPEEEKLSTKSGALRPTKDLAVQRVLRPEPPRINAAAGREEPPELVPDPDNPKQFIMKDFLREK